MLADMQSVQGMQVAQTAAVIACTTLAKACAVVAHDPGPMDAERLPSPMIFGNDARTDRPSVTMAAGVLQRKSWSSTRAAP